MPSEQIDRHIPLPKGWSRRVRSAVVHAVAVDHCSLTVCRGWAARTLDARIQLWGENDRLRQELALFKEESCIKGRLDAAHLGAAPPALPADGTSRDP